MKVSDSVPSSSARPIGAAAYGLGGAWLLAHLPFLSPALEDIDSINFALGLHHYDPALHQPHPPGYPVFIAAGRVALSLIHLAAPGLSYVRADALALAIWSALGGALAIVAAAHLFRELTTDGSEAPAAGIWGAALMAVTPLFWMTGLRPMSDMFGLGVALAAQALLLRGARARRWLIAGGLIAGLAAGIRTQTVPLTVPLFCYALYAQRRQGVWLARPIAAGVAGGLAWGVPMIALAGGIDGYLRALGTQAGEDFAWVDMLWANPTPRATVVALYDSVVLPFEVPALGVAMLVIAMLGGMRLLLRDRRSLVLLGIAFVPYAVFHLLFQEAANLRYATPLVPPIAYLVARAIAGLPPVRTAWLPAPQAVRVMAAMILVAGMAGLVIRPTVAYGRDAHPAFRAIADMTAAAEQERSRPAAVFSHYSLRRPLQAQPTSLPVVEATRNYEWLAMEKYWRAGGQAPVWFLADPKRTDLALVDPQQRLMPMRYAWAAGTMAAFMGTRPMGVDWYRFDPPGWFAAEGWELTPETAGIARATNQRLHQRPITAYVRRRPDAMTAIIGGRDLGPASDPASLFEVAIDGQVVGGWRLEPARDGIHFFHVLPLPNGIPAGPGNYATLTIAARAEDLGRATPQVAVEQFDIQPADTVMFGFTAGWQEAEYDNRTGAAWRWTSDRATLRILPARAVRIAMRGESPLKYFDAPPTVRFRAGTRELAVFRPDRDFTWVVPVPAAALAASSGVITIETDKVYLPGQAEGTADARRLGLRIFDTQVTAAPQ